MYKIVLNQCAIGLILLSSSYFSANAQIKGENSPIAYASIGVRSDHPPSDTIIIAKPSQTDTSWKPLRRVWGYAFGDF